MSNTYQHIIRPQIQPKSDLSIGQPDDQYEKEADAVATQVMRKPTESLPIMRKCEDCEEETIQRKPETEMIQREEEPVATVTKDAEPPASKSEKKDASSSKRTDMCFSTPQFPNFPCLLAALKLDVDENLWNNAHHFYRTATLYPGRSDLMLDTFMRYGVGLNNLQTIYGFTGVGDTTRDILSYATGAGLKTYTFAKTGELQLDIPIPIKEGLNFEFNMDLNANPDNVFKADEWKVKAGVGVSGSF